MKLLASRRFGEHVTPPGHPERIERAGVFDEIAAWHRSRGGSVQEPRPVTDQELRRVHESSYLELIDAVAGRAVMLDPDTFTSPESVEIAKLAAGAAVDAASIAWRSAEATLALVRPPGHHAEPARAMGFCLYNNIAVAAAAVRAAGAARVAIVDFDVHHGNGTQAAFYADPSVLFVSTHQYPYYPGTGAATETGTGPGLGFTLNVPMPAGAGDDAFVAAYERTVVPAVLRFEPEVILVSAGYDAHECDPLAGMRLTTEGFASIVGFLRATATEACGGRLAFVTEGGYHLGALRECLQATVE